MKVALAQINTTVGDVEGNVRKVVAAIHEAAARGAQMVVLPELTLSGYPPQDLVERPAFVEANRQGLRRVAAAAHGIYAVVGHVGRAPTQTGKLAANCASVVRDGKVLCRRDKTLLPAYDVFDESRLFQPAADNEPVVLGDLKAGVTICEDTWNDRYFWERRMYETDPIEKLAAAGIDLLLNISASPFSVGKQQFRRAMLSASARRHAVPLAYVNLVGGNDQLIFDGRSIMFDAQGRIVAEGAAFREELLVVDTGQAGAPEPPPTLTEVEEIWQALNLGLADYVRKCGFKKVVLGLSGGVDSAVTACIAASALGPENVTALFMPTLFTSELSYADARAVARNLGIEYHAVPVEELRLSFERALEPVFRGTERGIAEENIQARIRGTLIMAYSNKYGHLPLATGNKSELGAGYCTLYGDMVGGLAVIGDVPKVMIYQLAHYINRDRTLIPRTIIERPPTAELKPNQTDQDVLPPYELLDAILNLYIEQNKEYDEIVAAGYDPDIVRRVLLMVDRAEYKRRQAPITLRVTSKAFGPGRRLPVAQNWAR
jgi:NAD+ synthetase